MGIDRLEDEDYPVLSVSQAAELLGVQPAFLRRLDAAGVVSSDRSVGGHRRYSRRQLVRAARMRELFDQGHTLAAAAQILGLQDDLDRVRDERDQARDERDQARGERDEARGRLGQAPDELLSTQRHRGIGVRRGGRGAASEGSSGQSSARSASSSG
jgi:MerR family transcriptional regulator/heat shock protein HspR